LFSLDAGTGIYKFGNNTYPQRIRRRSNLGHIFHGKKCVLWARNYGNYTCPYRMSRLKFIGKRQTNESLFDGMSA